MLLSVVFSWQCSHFRHVSTPRATRTELRIRKIVSRCYSFRFVAVMFTMSISLQTVSISMYFGVSWLDPRLRINTKAPEWKEAKTGPKDVS